MSELVILLGIGKSGKTTFAKIFEGRGYKRISIDGHFKYNSGIQAWFDLVKYVTSLLNKNPKQNYVLDGYINACTCKTTGRRIYTGHGFEAIGNHLKHHSIEPIVVVQDKYVLWERGSKETEERISWLYSWFLTMKGINNIVLGSRNNIEVLSRNSAMKIVIGEYLSPELVGSRHVLDRLKRRKIEKAPHHGDPYYQTIELAGKYVVPGYNGGREHKTWKRIKDYLDIKNKDVAEVGCHHGFYLLKMKEEGSARTIGYDYNPWTVESAEQIAHFRGLDVNYKLLNIDTQDLPEYYDTILVMNALRHFKDQDGSLGKLFIKAKSNIVFETQYDLEKLKSQAKKYGFKKVLSLPGRKHAKKKERNIVFFERER